MALWPHYLIPTDPTKLMRFLPALIVGILLSTLVALPTQAQETEWEVLFDGESMDGWSHVGEGDFVLEDGVLKTKGGLGLFWYTEKKFGNVELQVEYRTVDSSNAGIHVRIPDEPADAWDAVHGGYEVQINPAGDSHHRTGVLYSLTEAKAEAGGGSGWNTMTITLDGDRTMVHVNGTLVTDFTEGDPVPPREADYEPERGPRPEEGYIGLQNHGDQDTVHYRRVRVRPLE